MYIYKHILFILFIFSFNLYCFTSVKISDNFYRVGSATDDVTDVNDIVFEDYSINLSTIDFPKLSTFLMVKSKVPILSIFLNLYEFMGYDRNVETSVSYLNFFRTLKTIEWYFLGDRNISAFFAYSSSMNINYNSMIRDLSASYSKFYTDTNILLGLYFYF